MTVIKYQFASISNTSQDILQSALTIDGQLEDLKARLRPMVDSWDGEAAEAYQIHQAKWDAAAEELNEILTVIGNTVENGNSRMKAVNTAAANSWA
ncbi:WXG100 family type VII secretion target [Corynebacterium genitalium ATCC 33030]|uniref:ESAT-6-like protein n=1 Tax=Corynebacterium genitalium ATCC 33030 TaxID=585529 RepID=D7WAS0_9CORY|nr:MULTISPECIES: WXG100 family type VII secretion target [Corynebacterium]EFK54951.1 WXG100 family type VII secretion target [Corynebacterium genitalium ATCC 33030]MCQ4620958.1 WXG100 family type VII secretion target [Corynebacterium sp. CCUG 71335]MCQ4622415.1 WXG100 family type VII secretion target [Corynebacterium sp. CCUG 70398]MCQ4624102.1 WXG100 family type VII secretion target [Corynebacterium sp. CCUG 69979]UUA89765.1 WXG100 family type VII secretion target [Corynebacterium genitalium 